MRTLSAFLSNHPRLASWIVLSIGMVVILFLAARGKGLMPGQLAGLAGACVVLAGVCAWIIGWE